MGIQHFNENACRERLARLDRGLLRGLAGAPVAVVAVGKYVPLVFTEQGVSMLSGVLKSQNAIQVHVAIMRTFVKLRGMLNSNRELGKKLEQLERTYDHKFKVVFEAIRKLMEDQRGMRRKRIRGLDG